MLLIKKLNRFILILLIIFAVIAILISVLVILNNNRNQMQQINSDDPAIVVSAFLHALSKNDLDLAKKFVIPKQYVAIEKWLIESNHEAFDCPIAWERGIGVLNTIVENGGAYYEEIKNNKTTVHAAFGCNGSNSSMSIEGVAVVYNGLNWKITHWGEICQSSARAIYNTPEICY